MIEYGNGEGDGGPERAGVKAPCGCYVNYSKDIVCCEYCFKSMCSWCLAEKEHASGTCKKARVSNEDRMEVLVLKRPDPKHKGCFQWLIANGGQLGRWTGYFGVNCLADMEDNKGYLRFSHIEMPGSVIEHYTLTKK